MPVSRRRPLFAVTLCALLAAWGGCADLQIIPPNECGNDVLEPDLGEECDGEADCGPPGAEHACRIVCPGGECRPGYACGLDGVCRAPSGVFEVLSATATTTAIDLFTGDVNVDRCHELFVVGRQGTTLTAFESRTPGACPASTQEIPSGRAPDKELSRPAPLLADMDRDGRPDLVRAAQAQYDDGLFIDLGGPAPQVASILYSTVRAREENVRPLKVVYKGRDALLLLLDNPMNMGGVGMAGVVDPRNVPQPAGGLPGSLGELVLLAAVELGDAPPPPGQAPCGTCDELLVGFAGDSQIHSVTLFPGAGMDGQETLAAGMPLPVIKLPEGAKLRTDNAAMAVVDADGDEILDVIVNVQPTPGMPGTGLVIAFGTGDGRFHSTSPSNKVAPDGETSPFMPPPGGMGPDPAQAEILFVAADFDPEQPGIEVQAIPCPPGEPVSSTACEAKGGGCEAVVVDIDGDGFLDIVSTEPQQPGLVLRRHAASGGFHVSSVDTHCQPRELTVGDFDDDGVDDLAFFDQVRPSSLLGSAELPVDTLRIAYGNKYAPPSAPVESGRFDDAQGLTAGRFSEDAPVTQLYAARSIAEGDLLSGFALVEGYGARQLFAPYYFPYDQMGTMSTVNLQTVSILGAGAGLFTVDEDENPTSAVALMRRAETPAGGDLLQLVDSQVGGSPLLPGNTGQSPSCDGCLLVPVDLPECAGEGGPDELLLLGQDEIIAYSVIKDPESGRYAFDECDRFTETGHGFSFVDAEPKPEKYAPRPLVADLDRDGRADVLARDTAGDMIVLWSEEGGGFDLVKLPFPEGGPASKCGGKCSVALVDTDGDDGDGRELFVVAPGGYVLYRVHPDRSFEELPLPGGLEQVEVTPDTDFTAVVAADLDGDQIQDMALMPSSGLLVTLRGVPVKE